MFAPVTAARVLSVLACAAGLLGPGLAAAATQSEASPVQAQLPPKLIVVSLSVNRREVGEAVMILSDRPLIEASALERAG